MKMSMGWNQTPENIRDLPFMSVVVEPIADNGTGEKRSKDERCGQELGGMKGKHGVNPYELLQLTFGRSLNFSVPQFPCQ